MFRGAKKRTFRFGKKNVSFPKVETFRFADYTSNAAKSGLGFIESLKIYDYLKSHGYLYGWRKHLTHGYYMWLIGHVKDYQNTQVKKNIYDLWKPKCSYPTLNKYLFILHRVYTKLVDLF